MASPLIKVAPFGFLFAVLSSTSALAVDAQAFADRLKAVSAEQGTTMNFASAQEEGENVVLADVTFGTGDDILEAGTVRFETVTGSTADGWQVERVPLADIDIAEDDTRTRIGGFVVEGLTIVGTNAAEEDALVPVQFDRASIASVEVEDEGNPVFRLTGLDVENRPADGGGFQSTFRVEELFADAATDTESEGARIMTELGYPQVRGSMSGQASWSPQNGALSLDPLEITVQDAGQLSFAYTITGYTPSFIQSLTQIQQQMAANPDGNQAGGMAMMGLISQLYLNSAELSFTDDSLTNRILDYYAEQNQQSRADLIGTLTGLLPLGLAYLNNPEFQQEVIASVERFLNDPQSLTISIQPDAPVPATQIIGAAMGAPQTLPAVLQLGVTSND